MSDLRNRAHLALVAAAGGAAAFFLLLRWQKHSSDSKRACTLAECFESHLKEVAVAVELALQCGAAMRACDGKRSATVWKDDHGIDPVTQTDQDNETLVTKGLAAAFPGHVIIGEEAAAAAENIPPLGRDASTWIVDPIGQRPLARSCFDGQQQLTFCTCCILSVRSQTGLRTSRTVLLYRLSASDSVKTEFPFSA